MNGQVAAVMSEQLVAEVDRHQLAAEAAAMQARPLVDASHFCPVMHNAF